MGVHAKTMDGFEYDVDEPMHEGVVAHALKRTRASDGYEWPDDDCATTPYSRLAKRRRVCEVSAGTTVEDMDQALVVVGGNEHHATAGDVLSAIPRTLGFALPTLSSGETLSIFSELVSVRGELSWLDGTQPGTDIHPVFGWRSAFWSVQSTHGETAIAFKSAKAFERVPMRRIAQRLWKRSSVRDQQDRVRTEVIYAVTDKIRIVQLRPSPGRAQQHSSLWLEYMMERGNCTMFVRKELHHFKDHEINDYDKVDRECKGYMLREMFVPVGGQIVGGTLVQSLGKLRKIHRTPEAQIASMVEELPSFLLSWEAAFVHDSTRLEELFEA